MPSTPDAWSIPTRNDRCSRCDSELPVGSRVTVLLDLASEGPRRDDLCTSCGQAVEEDGEAIFWRSERVEDGDQRPVVDYGFLREMFGRLLQRDEPVYRRLSYLVGLVLVRKRHLRLKGFERRDGREVMIVTRSVDSPDLLVPAPHLSAEDMVETRELLRRLLAADLPESEIPTEAPQGEADGAEPDGSGDLATDDEQAGESSDSKSGAPSSATSSARDVGNA